MRRGTVGRTEAFGCSGSLVETFVTGGCSGSLEGTLDLMWKPRSPELLPSISPSLPVLVEFMEA